MSTLYAYEPGTVRWRKHDLDSGDIHLVYVPRGWKAELQYRTHHPTGGQKLRQTQWWVKETYIGTPK